MQVKVVIQQLDNRNGFEVSVIDGRKIIVKTIEEAIELKERIDNE